MRQRRDLLSEDASPPAGSDPLRGRYRKNPGLVTREIAEETLLVPVKGRLARLQQIFVLNPVAGHVWERIDGERSLGEIERSILEEFDVGPEQARQDLLELVEALRAAELILEVAEEPAAGDGGV